jgi:hypothetical protein
MSALVRWLPKLAVASARDTARFGPNAARVRSLLDFLPAMSNDAYEVGRAAMGAADDAAMGAARRAADDAAMGAARRRAYDAARDDSSWVAGDAAYDGGMGAAENAATGEVLSDLISPENYRILTSPLATGRAVDVLAPRYKNTQFRELLQELAPNSVIAQPADVLGVGRIARSPEEIRDIALTLIKDGGMTIEEAYNAARLLA